MRWTIFGIFAAAAGLATAGAAFTPVTIPLSFVVDNEGENKVGLYAYVGYAGGSLPPGAQNQFYQLDTGSSGFFAAYAENTSLKPGVTQWWGPDVTQKHVSGVASYGSNVSLNFDVVTTSVILSNSSGAQLLTINGVQMGQVQTASNPTSWQADTEEGEAPLHGTFYGNFGAALNQHSPTDSASLFTLLGQVPGAGGFIVHMGNMATPDPANPPMLTVGITDDMRAEFPYATALTGAMTGLVFPGSGYAAYTEEYSSVVSLTFDNGSSSQTVSDVASLFDTGAPSTTVRKDVDAQFYDSSTGDVYPGVTFSMQLAGADGSPDFTISWLAGNIASYNEVSIDDNGAENINAGLSPYSYYDIMFDLEEGVMRFRPIPEPSVLALALLGLAGVAGLLYRRKAFQLRISDRGLRIE